MAAPNPCTAKVLQEICLKENFSITEVQAVNLANYLNLLMLWNKAMNLVGAKHWRNAFDNLVADSFYLSDFLRQLEIQSENISIWDLGSGAGLPGIPLRILWQQGSYTLVESREKRAIFLSTVLSRLKLAKTFVFHGRAENFMQGKKADIILSRAFMPWDKLLPFVSNNLQDKGFVVFLSNNPLPMEMAHDWNLFHTQSYIVQGEKRFFSALQMK